MSDFINPPPHADHVVAVYTTHGQAENAIKMLQEDGFPMADLSIVGQDYHTEEHPVGFVNTGERMWSWGKYGAFWGTIWGTLFGSAMLIIPGIGPVLFAGWIVSALQGALIGGGIAALGGALTSIGIPEDTVVQYETEIKAGSFLVFAHGTKANLAQAEEILSKTSSRPVDSFSNSGEPIASRS